MTDAEKPQGIFAPGSEFFVGCNYWASHAGTAMWRDWRPEVVEADFRLLAENGVEVARVFPLWPDFQPIQALTGGGQSFVEMRFGERPLPDTPAGRAGVDEVMVERFRELCRVAEANRIKLIVGLVTGWMSGRMHVPPAFERVNVITDPTAIRWQVRMVRYLVRELRGCPATNATAWPGATLRRKPGAGAMRSRRRSGSKTPIVRSSPACIRCSANAEHGRFRIRAK